MKLNIALFFTILLLACNNTPKDNTQVKPAEDAQVSQQEQSSFFPVTDFIKGQIADIKKDGINPIKKTRINNKEDSSWLKIEELDKEFAPFLSPVIDSASLKGMFTEKSFLDQTIDAYTFTYDPVKPLPDSFQLNHWDVYVDPRSNTVRRIYMLKKIPGNKILQLTWQTNNSCKIVSIANDHVEKEVTIKWDF